MDVISRAHKNMGEIAGRFPSAAAYSCVGLSFAVLVLVILLIVCRSARKSGALLDGDGWSHELVGKTAPPGEGDAPSDDAPSDDAWPHEFMGNDGETAPTECPPGCVYDRPPRPAAGTSHTLMGDAAPGTKAPLPQDPDKLGLLMMVQSQGGGETPGGDAFANRYGTDSVFMDMSPDVLIKAEKGAGHQHHLLA